MYTVYAYKCMVLADPTHIHTPAWAQMEMDLGRMAAAKQVLGAALEADPGHMPSYTVCVCMCVCV